GQVAAWPMSPGMRGKRVSSIRMPTLAPYTVLPPWTWFRSASAILTLPLLLHPRGARRDDPLRGRECLRQGSCSDRAEGYDAPWRGTGLKETDYGRERKDGSQVVAAGDRRRVCGRCDADAGVG